MRQQTISEFSSSTRFFTLAYRMTAMPVYEYEPMDRECLMCEGRVSVIQDVGEATLQFCPHCGLDVRRVISKASIKIAGAIPEDKAAKHGFLTYRRAERGVWEKVSGEGPELMVGTKTDMDAVEAERARESKIIDLDKP
jgi:putative FmdB family regulatory protein